MRLEERSTREVCASAATLMRLRNCLAVTMSIQFSCNQVSNTESADWSIGDVFFEEDMLTRRRSSVTANAGGVKRD